MNIAVFGGGSWATAIVKILTQTHDKVYWWVREEEIKNSITQYGYNDLYLSYCEIDNHKVYISNDIHEIVLKGDVLFFVIPAAFLETSLSTLNKQELKGKKIVSAIKGIIPSTNQVVSNWIKDYFDVPLQMQGVISGPSHAEEAAQDKLTYLTCASTDKTFAQEIANIISCRFVKTVLSDDIIGIEYGAVMKNIYALAAGIVKGMGYGDNFIAVLIANATREMECFLEKITSKQRNINNLVYLGDLLVTCYSQHSRNRTFGQMIGQGYSVQSAQLEMKMIAEGYYSALCVHKDNELHNCKLPIAEFVYNVLYKQANKESELDILKQQFS